jgi:hypothetical protein
VKVRANVVFATEYEVARRSPDYTKAQVSFSTPGGDIAPVFAEIIDCPESRLEPDAESVDVLYDPARETDVRMPECLDKSYKLSLFAGAGLLLVAVGLLVAIAKGGGRAARRGIVAPDV